MLMQKGLSDVSAPVLSVPDPQPDQGPEIELEPAANLHSASISVSLLPLQDFAATGWSRLPQGHYSIAYQTPAWLTAWSGTIGKALGIKPLIAVGTIHDRSVVILPLGLERKAGTSSLSFLGHQNGNQNTGLWDPDFYACVTSGQISSLLAEICRQAGADLLALQNVPEVWHGRAHPLALDGSVASPSPIFVRALPEDFESLFRETHSKSSRKNLARKQKHLQAVDGYRVVRAETQADLQRGLTAFLDQRARRALEAGIPNAFSGPAAQDFLTQALGVQPQDGADSFNSLSGSEAPALCLWFLEADGVIRSTYLCAEHNGILYAYSNSVAHDELLPNSPGLVLIKEIIGHACAAPGLDSLDLGLGEERYKTAWAEPEALKDCLLAATWKGRLARKIHLAATGAKAGIRNSERLWPMIRRVRKWKAGLGSGSGH